MPTDAWLEKIADLFDTTPQWLREKHYFNGTGDGEKRRMCAVLEDGDVHAFFGRLERALSHPERGDIVISITMKPCRSKKANTQQHV